MKKTLIILVLFFSTSISSLVWGAETYDDCILKNMKNIESDLAAKAIIDACKGKHKNTTSSEDEDNINGVIVYSCVSGKLEIKFDTNDIKNKTLGKNGIFIKTKKTDYIWERKNTISYDDEQIIMWWESKKFNRLRFDLIRKEIIFYHSSEEGTQNYSCYRR